MTSKDEEKILTDNLELIYDLLSDNLEPIYDTLEANGKKLSDIKEILKQILTLLEK